MDLIWIVLFAAIGVVMPQPNDAEYELLGLLALMQVAEPRVPFFLTRPGALVAIFVKLLLAYLFVGVSGAITSTYYMIFLVPIVSAVTSLGAWASAGMSVISCAAYLSFLFYLDWERYVILPDQARELGVRVLLLIVVALLMHQIASATRARARQYVRTAEDLATANRNLAEAVAAVRRSERLAAIGQLMAGLAHELRNPLGTMRASAEVLVKNIPEDLAVPRELAGYIREEVDRTDSLVTRFLDFARPLQLRPAPAVVNDIVDRAIAALGRIDPPLPVTIHRNYSPDIPQIACDAELLERVFYNLILNAAQASPSGGTVSVKTRALNGSVEVDVIDRGTGIDPAERENIFNPFFTTKPGGTGLGLAIVSKIIDEHRGAVVVESEPGQGSVFRVLLPKSA